ncbi:peptidase M32 [Pyrodictium occultum]|uniref:Metal-dependent carboxypeptidase n=1 Tax=Pyrodictium occultum TaxID=2309 RepID=A0A0V8RVQ3_PYROC|nr:carboxypeptidase M32 [Pyrodictium occultum]KSW12115.1 peptidase M32 [Pyrodictium occultum]
MPETASEAGTLFRDETVRRILGKYRLLWALGHALSLMGWDLETYMPRAGVKDRSTAAEELEGLSHRLLLDPELDKLLREAEEKLDSLNVYERGVVRVLRRAVRIAKAVPEELARREARVTSEATQVWKEAKKKADFKMFKPYLEEIVEIQRRKAELLGYEDHPYDALLDLYEEGLRVRHLDPLFNELVPATRRILDRVLTGGFYPSRHPLEDQGYDVERARAMLRRLLDDLGWPWDRGRLDESAHPFTIDMGIDDVRITVRYEGRDIKRAVYSLVHEYGHALYQLQIDRRLAYTPIGTGVSMGVHESQSRFWENVVGRGPWFMGLLSKRLAEHLGLRLEPLELYRYVNTVRPDLIRVDADEVTYNLHIYLRYILEKKLIEGSVMVDELPQAWDDMMEDLLGVRPRSPSEGVLQDIHWSHGSFGYFPTYTLGNVIAAMIWRRLWSGSPELLTGLDLAGLRAWLGERIHRWGATFPPLELVERSLGGKPSAAALVEYLEWKFLRLPGELEEYLPRG